MRKGERTAIEAISADLKAKAEVAALLGDGKHAEVLALEDGGASPAEIAKRESEQKQADDLAEALAGLSQALEDLAGRPAA